MSKESISQRRVMEILVKEIETLHSATKTIHEVAPVVKQRLNEVKELRLTASLDSHEINDIKRTLSNFSDKLDRKLSNGKILPNWVVIAFISMFDLFGASVGLNVHWKAQLEIQKIDGRNIEEWKELAESWYDTAVKYGYEPKN